MFPNFLLSSKTYTTIHTNSDIDSRGNLVDEDRPSGADAEHRQAAKTINCEHQRQLREDRRLKKASEQQCKEEVAYNTIQDILQQNSGVEQELQDKTESGYVSDATVQDFLDLKPASKLENLIHARRFDGHTFQKSKLTGSDGKLNKTLHKKQSAEEIERNCSNERPCLVWLAWSLRSKELVLKAPPMPTVDTRVMVPEFKVMYASKKKVKKASEYLGDQSWVDMLGVVVKGVSCVPISDELKEKADYLALAFEPRLGYHVSKRVDQSRHNHWTLRFTQDNFAPMAAAMCLFGHIVDDLCTYGWENCLLKLPMEEVFQIISGDLDGLEGCYLYFDRVKNIWVRSGKTSGEGKDACFEGRGRKHYENSQSIEEMRKSTFYRTYPTVGVANLGGRGGYFSNLDMHCGMAFDIREDITHLCCDVDDGGLFVWSEECMSELKKRSGALKTLQLDAISYLWEICYDLLIARGDNVSGSPGFEALGLRVNTRKRKKNWD